MFRSGEVLVVRMGAGRYIKDREERDTRHAVAPVQRLCPVRVRVVSRSVVERVAPRTPHLGQEGRSAAAARAFGAQGPLICIASTLFRPPRFARYRYLSAAAIK